ncbi:MAG: transcription antitermination factor NusB [Bacteroidetes bacterium]|nr:transcription antitermination factor NusB [Bacteroidota bacterium]
MLSRRHLRTKVLQSLYAFIQSGNSDIVAGEKHLIKSIDKLYELYIYQLSLLIEIVDFAKKRSEENKKKYFPTRDELNPNTKFIDNKLIRQISDNRDYQRYYNKYKINWSEEQEMIRKLYNMTREGKFFKKFMETKGNGYESDKEILQKIIKKIIAPYEFLEQYYEDKTIFWSFEDFYTANMMVLKTIKAVEETWTDHHPLPELFKETPEGELDDRKYMLDLFRKSILHFDENRELIAERAKNWELDRIAIMDILLINMALVELTDFPSIPVKVTMNEYIEISKYYSSSKSKLFINGILDKMVEEFRASKKIRKTGRGLLDN